VQRKPSCWIPYKLLILNDLSGFWMVSWTILSPLRLPVPPSRRNAQAPSLPMLTQINLPPSIARGATVTSLIATSNYGDPSFSTTPQSAPAPDAHSASPYLLYDALSDAQQREYPHAPSPSRSNRLRIPLQTFEEIPPSPRAGCLDQSLARDCSSALSMGVPRGSGATTAGCMYVCPSTVRRTM
jgi:hypothetical protein